MTDDGSTTVDFELNKMVKKTFDSTEIQNRLESGELHLALLLASTKVEQILSDTIMDALSISQDQFEAIGFSQWSLGSYVSTVEDLNRLTKQEKGKYRIGDLVDKRNNLAHDDGYATSLENNQEEADAVREILHSVIEFVESVVIDSQRTTILPSQ